MKKKSGKEVKIRMEIQLKSANSFIGIKYPTFKIDEWTRKGAAGKLVIKWLWEHGFFDAWGSTLYMMSLDLKKRGIYNLDPEITYDKSGNAKLTLIRKEDKKVENNGRSD